MKVLANRDLAEINGGLSTAVWTCIAVGVVFLASIVYGFINPDKCNS